MLSAAIADCAWLLISALGYPMHDIAAFHDQRTGSVTYVVADRSSGACAIVDSVLGFEPATAAIDQLPLAPVLEHVRSNSLRPQWLLETHVHADHLSGARQMKSIVGGQTAIGCHFAEVQRHLATVLGSAPTAVGPLFDRYLEHGTALPLGESVIEVMHTPGHTPACVSYLIGEDAFVGDTLFMPDCGTARCDFPGGDAATLFCSLQRLLELDPDTALHVGHDYGADGRRPVAWRSTVREQRAHNVHLAGGRTEAEFVALRTRRDATLGPPRLFQPSLRFNIGLPLSTEPTRG